MKTLRTLALMAAVIIGMLTSGYANAGNNRKGEVTELTSATFKTTVYDITKEGLDYLGKKPAIVDFTATWCGPCKRITPILEELAKEYEGQIVIYKVDVEKEKGLAQAFNVSSIPAVLYIPLSGEPVMTVGARGKERFIEEIGTLLLQK
jgi:thioredoxin